MTPLRDKSDEKASQERETSRFFVRGEGSPDLRGQRASYAAPKTGSDVGGDGVVAEEVAFDMPASASEPLAEGAHV